MGKVLKILGTVGKIFLIILVVVSSLLSLAMAYIVFAPDDLPKPFYLSYLYPTPVPTPDPSIEVPVMEETHVVEEVHPGEGIMIDTGTKIINLAEPGGRRYIRINVVLEFTPPHSGTEEDAAAGGGHGGEGEAAVVDPAVETFTNSVNAKLPMINDTVITLLSSKSFEQLYTTDGKELLRHEIMDKIQAMMPNDKVLGVYFTEFVVE